jgi:hypothetical protein
VRIWPGQWTTGSNLGYSPLITGVAFLPLSAGLIAASNLTAIGLGLVSAPAINTGTFGVAPQDAGVASATVTVGQQLGAWIGTALLNTIFAGGAVISGALLRNGSLNQADAPSQTADEVPTAQAKADPALPA